ncbi:MAG: sigma-54 interaction domain-containing protein [Planctomycetota bacterium]
MKEHQELLLDIWREACRHIDIADSAAHLSDIIQPVLPHDRLELATIEVAEQHIELCATGGEASGPCPEKRLYHADEEQMERLADWCRHGEVHHLGDCGDALPAPFEGLPVEWFGGYTFVGPLCSAHETLGMVVIGTWSDEKAEKWGQPLFHKLLEPLAVALENDHRLRELRALREAAEADKRALLSKLGRRKINERIVGSEGGLEKVMERVELVASSDMPVLLLGETGSGKEVIARAIHDRSRRCDGPFIRVNCGAIPPELIDSELFGHEEGSFTGATSQRKGWFERADEGTLLLDEVAELPPPAQVRLLRVIEQGQLERVGGGEPLRVDVRIIAATHRDLGEMVQEGTFREDLWYRIVAFPVVIPPLRERTEDIGELARHFARRAASRLGLPEQMPSEADVQLLGSYHWPGNVRELKSVIERAAILGDGDGLEVTDALGLGDGIQPLSDGDEDIPEEGVKPRPEAMQEEFTPLGEAMRRHIIKALKQANGQIEGDDGAAELLDINPHTLRGRMRKLDIDWARFRP